MRHARGLCFGFGLSSSDDDNAWVRRTVFAADAREPQGDHRVDGTE